MASYDIESLRFERDPDFALSTEPHPPESAHGIVERRWTHRGDLLQLRFFPQPDPQPVDPRRVAQLRALTRELARAQGAGLIEAAPLLVGSEAAAQMILKHPCEPRGFVFAGGISLHVAGVAYSIHLEYPEQGVTGARETAVALQLGIAPNPGLLGKLFRRGPRWSEDPYDPAEVSPVMRCRADDREWDAQFPDHPLSRLRVHLRRIAETIRLVSD